MATGPKKSGTIRKSSGAAAGGIGRKTGAGSVQRVPGLEQRYPRIPMRRISSATFSSVRDRVVRSFERTTCSHSGSNCSISRWLLDPRRA